jgi:hypothetical protein
MAALLLLPLLLLSLPAGHLAAYLRYPSSDILWTNETIFPQSTLNNVTALSSLCDATPGCLGFNANGWLKKGK